MRNFIITLALLLGAGTSLAATESMEFEIGSSRLEVQEVALSESGTRLYRDQIERTSFGVTFKPFGMHPIRDLLEFQGNQAVRLVRSYDPWHGRIDTPKAELKAGDLKVIEALREAVRRREAVMVHEDATHEIYSFKNDTTEGRILISHEAPASGLFHEWLKGSDATFTPLIKSEMWFGLGTYLDGKANKERATTMIPSEPNTKFIWEVQIGESELRDYELAFRFPSTGQLPEIPEGIDFDQSRREITMPIGAHDEKVVIEMAVEEGDPLGTWQLALLLEGEVVAAVSYQLVESGE